MSRDPLDGACRWVDRPEDLAEVAETVARARLVALDTESNSMHAYRERTCVVQVTVGDETALLDAIALRDLGPLRVALDRPGVEVVFHGGDYDVSVLTRDHDFRFDRVFDTMIAATLLGVEKVGLADLVHGRFGVVLDKRYQTADWARRPLTRDQVEYLRRDTVFLEPLRDDLYARLADADLLEEAEIEFRRLAGRRGRTAEFDPEGWRRLKGAIELGAEGRAVLDALFRWREREAERRDVAPFRVLRPDLLVSLAARPPRSAREASERRLFRDPRLTREVAAVVAEGLSAAARGDAPPPPANVPLTEEERRRRNTRRRREEALRDWRKREAARRRVPNLVVLPNPALEWILDTLPRRAEDLAAHPDVGPKRARLYAEEILDVLHGAGPPGPPAGA